VVAFSLNSQRVSCGGGGGGDDFPNTDVMKIF
jgi:hypothetical protein